MAENIFFTTTFPDGYYYEDYYDYEYYRKVYIIMHVVTCIIIAIGLPLMLMAIYALYSLVQNDHVVPIYIINLLITDLIQLCCLIVWESKPQELWIYEILYYVYNSGLVTSVCFMVCISLERYLVIAHPMWYHFKQPIRSSVAICVVVWLIAPVYFLTVYPWVTMAVTEIVFSVFLTIPLPLFIFSLVGTLRALSTSVSVSPDEKRRIVRILVLVLLIYTLLFLPSIIWIIAKTKTDPVDNTLNDLSFMFVKLSPLADLLLYVFIRKETFEKLLTSVCCCRKERSDTNNSNTINVDNI
ncbi:G-protein coupled receptor 4-like [Cheilinus undulatus]|uniref:G-protein coupled receptor 4-like n=1 Tax=Cheilinus undulatus TaxID=241271 RepID=UPI001BD32939|nr:G-protein coupled receptor 4-like [Cheilinus undulatus]